MLAVDVIMSASHIRSSARIKTIWNVKYLMQLFRVK